MNKFNLIIVVFLLLFCGCQRKQTTQSKVVNASKTDSIETITEFDSIDIYGKWYYTEYTDSTIQHKKIYDYSWTLASFAYEIIIDKENPDSVVFKGYHEGWTEKLEKNSDNTYRVGDENWNWTLRFEKLGNTTKLYVKQYINPTYAQKADPKEYVLTKKNLHIDNEELYFTKHIISGKYIDSYTGSTLILKENLELIGVDFYNKYSILIDFWEMVPQMDIITFYEGNYNKMTHYNWEFKGDSLILSSIISLYDNGETIGPDVKNGDYAGAEIDKVIYRLKRIK